MKNRLVKYLVLTFAITWLCWLGDALLVKLTAWSNSDFLPMALFTLGGFGPTIAGCVCMEGGFSWKKLGSLLFGLRKKGIWCLSVLAALEILTFALSASGFLPDIPQGVMPKIVVSSVVFLQAATLYGGNEELGWRGTMQPILRRKLPLPVAALLVGVVWVAWHLPLWLIEGDSHQDMPLLFFAAFGILLSIWLGAIYDRTQCVFPCMLFHGLTNTLMGILVYSYEAPVFLVGVGTLTLVAVMLPLAGEKSGKTAAQ